MVTEEAKHKAKAEVARLKVARLKVASLKVERTSLLLEIGATKDKISSPHSQASKDKEAIEEDYQKALEVIFAYAFGCCAFKHNIYGDQPEVPDGMPVSFDQLLLEFFVSPRCPLVPMATKDIAVEARPSEVAKEPEENASAEDQS